MNITYTLEKLYAKDNLYFPINGAWVRVNGYGTANAEFIFPFATTSEHHRTIKIKINMIIHKPCVHGKRQQLRFF